MLKVILITTGLVGSGLWLSSGLWLKRGQSLDRQPGSPQAVKSKPVSQKMDEPKYCELSTDNRASWENCLGKLVKVTGNPPKVVMQHVLRAGNPLGGTPLNQSYMDALNYQFVLLSKEPIACQGPFEVEGVLKRFTLNQAAGTKGSYANYDIHVTRFQCLGQNTPSH